MSFILLAMSFLLDVGDTRWEELLGDIPTLGFESVHLRPQLRELVVEPVGDLSVWRWLLAAPIIKTDARRRVFRVEFSCDRKGTAARSQNISSGLISASHWVRKHRSGLT
jgi:hypothetical protein